MNTVHNFKRAMVGGVSALGLILGSAAFAADSGKLEEIIVTAQKRSENLQKVPISIVKITPKSLQSAGVLKTDDLQAAVPGMQFGHEINSATVFIRGIGPNSNGTGEESSVAIYLDDLYIPSGDASVFNLNAVDGVEVSKGPQGTLFGRNATGGVIQVKTKDPTFTPEVDAHLGYGNYDTKSGDIYASDAIIPGKLAANIAIYGNNESEGWGRDVVTGARAFTSNEFGGRVKFLFTPTDSTKVKLAAGHIYERGEEGAGFNQLPGLPVIPGYLPAPTGAKYVGFYNTEDNPNDVAVNKHDFIELRVDQETPWAKIVSITGWQRFNGFVSFNQDGNGLLQTRLNQVGRTGSQEVQLLSPDDASYAPWFKWIVGGFYEHDKSGYNNALLGGPAIVGEFDAAFHTLLPASTDLDLTDQVTTTSWAGFAQGTFTLTPKTHITAGVRYSVDEKVFEGGTSLLTGGPPLTLSNFTAGTPGDDRSWYMRTYRFSIAHDFTNNINGYFSFNRGIKSGQFDTFGTAESGPAVTPPVNPETLYAYELGLKSELLGHRLRLNADVFHYNISNLQLARIVSGATQLLNAAGAEIDGVEADTVYKPIPRLVLSGGVSAQYGHYSSFANAPDYFVASQTFDATGAQTVRTPKFTGHIAADYIIPQPYGDFDLNANLTHTTKFNWFPDGSLQQPATDILNASVSWTDPSDRYEVRLWGSNILGQQYYSYGSESAGLGEQFSPEPPATFGITLGYHFT